MSNVDSLKKRYDKYGTIMFDLEKSFFLDDDFKNLEELLAKLPYEYISTGDAGEDNSVEVGRLMTDIKNPKVVNESISNLALKILNKEKTPYLTLEEFGHCIKKHAGLGGFLNYVSNVMINSIQNPLLMRKTTSDQKLEEEDEENMPSLTKAISEPGQQFQSWDSMNNNNTSTTKVVTGQCSEEDGEQSMLHGDGLYYFADLIDRGIILFGGRI